MKVMTKNKRMGEIENRLYSKGVRPTAMRILIYKLLAQKDSAMSLTAIEDALEKADRTTLYRTLKTFKERGVVHQIDDGTGLLKYALCDPSWASELEQDTHLHFHCKICDETICLIDYRIPNINLPEGFVTENANLVLIGVCAKCSIE